MTTNGPTKTSDLTVTTSISQQARVVVIATVAGSLQTMTVPLSVIQAANALGPLDSLTDVSLTGSLTDNMGLVYSSSQAQWVAASVGDLKSSNNLSDVNAVAARANLDVLSSASIQTLLGTYITSSSVATALAPYLTSASAVTLVANFITSASASTMVHSQLSTYITSSSVATALAPYLTSASAVTLVANFITSASASALTATLLGPYVTSASMVGAFASVGIVEAKNIQALANVTVSSAVEGQFLVWNSVTSEFQNRTIDYVTSASLATVLVPYLTSASLSVVLNSYLTSTGLATAITSALAPYITSASAYSAFATVNTNKALVSLTDVSAPNINLLDGAALLWSTSRQQWIPIIVGPVSGGITALTSAVDVSLNSLLDGQWLRYRTSDSKWHNETPDYLSSASASTQYSSIAHTHTIDALSDVSTGTPLDTYVVAWSSAKNQYILQSPATGGGGIGAIASAADVTVSSGLNGQLLVFRTSDNKWHNETFDFVTSTALSAKDYITSTQASALVQNFITSASASTLTATLLAPYLTSASGVTAYGGKITRIVSAADVTVSSPTDNQMLVFVSSDAKWHNQNIPDWITSAAASVLVSSLVVNFITSASASTMVGTLLGPYLTSASGVTAYGGKITTLASATDVTISAAVNGNHLIYRTADSKWHSETIPDWITSAAASVLVSSLVVNFITSASASTMVGTLLGPYLTSASGVTAYGGKITTLASATDVTISAAVNGNHLIYRTADSKWHSEVPPDWITSAAASVLVSSLVVNFITSASASVLVSSLITGKAATSQIFDWSGYIEAPTNKTYIIHPNVSFGGTINETTTITSAGAITATWKINATALGATNIASASQVTQAQSSNNVFVTGDTIKITFSSNSAAADLAFKIKYTRTLS